MTEAQKTTLRPTPYETPFSPRHDDTPPLSMKELKELCATLKQKPELPANPLPILGIGAGGIVREGHFPAYAQCGWKVVGITDINKATAEETAKMFNIPKVYTTLSEMVDAHRNEKVVYDIAVPASAILGILKQIPEGSYALIQKPMGETLQEAKAILDECTNRNITAAINHQLRTAPFIIAMKDLIARGVIGEITSIDFRTNVYMPWKKWVFLEKAKRVEIIYHSIHYIDLLRDLYGDPKSLHCYTYKQIDNPNLNSVASNLLLVYSPWVQTTIHSNHQHKWGLKFACCDLKIEGSKGCVVVRMGMHVEYPRNDLDFLQVCTDATNGEWYSVPLEGSWMPEAFKGPMANVMRKAEGSLDEIPTSVKDAVKTMALIEAAYKSCDNTTPIDY